MPPTISRADLADLRRDGVRLLVAATSERASLETGTMEFFAPARAFYARAGFTPCPPFGA